MNQRMYLSMSIHVGAIIISRHYISPLLLLLLLLLITYVYLFFHFFTVPSSKYLPTYLPFPPTYLPTHTYTHPLHHHLSLGIERLIQGRQGSGINPPFPRYCLQRTILRPSISTTTTSRNVTIVPAARQATCLLTHLAAEVWL